MARGDARLRTNDDHLNQISGRLRGQRESLDLTQDALCARLATATIGKWNPDRRDIYKMERGKRTVTDLEIIALATALECDPRWLFLGD